MSDTNGIGSTTLEICEFETDPFTDDERASIARYTCRVAGVPDCFDVNTLAAIPGEFSVGDVIMMFRSYYGMLADWRSAVHDLRGDLTDLGLHHGVPYAYPHGEAFSVMPLSVAATRYLQMEMADYIAARDGHRVLIAEYFIGHNEHGDPFDYATTYHGCELTDLGFVFAENP